jgi:hypothetical protein
LNCCLFTLEAQPLRARTHSSGGAGARGPAATDNSNWAPIEVRRANRAAGNRSGDRSRNARATSRIWRVCSPSRSPSVSSPTGRKRMKGDGRH